MRIGCSACPSLLSCIFVVLFWCAFLFFRWCTGVFMNDGAQVPATNYSSSFSILNLLPGCNAHLEINILCKMFCSSTFSSNCPCILFCSQLHLTFFSYLLTTGGVSGGDSSYTALQWPKNQHVTVSL